MKKMFGAAVSMSAAALLVSGCATARLGPVSRDTLSRYRDAVVQVNSILKIEVTGGSSSGAAQEQPIETLGTVIHPSGLTVVAASALNPLGAIGTLDIQGTSVRPQGSTSQIRLRMSDGSEIPMKQVVTDEDLDLAFLAPDPEKPAPKQTFASVPLDPAAEAKVMDELITVGRAGKLFNWEPAVGVVRIFARITKPRVNYLFSGGYSGGLGTPAFTTEGRCMGIIVLKRSPAMMTGRQMTSGGAAVILPSADVAEVATTAMKEWQRLKDKAAEKTRTAAPKAEDKPKADAKPQADAKPKADVKPKADTPPKAADKPAEKPKAEAAPKTGTAPKAAAAPKAEDKPAAKK